MSEQLLYEVLAEAYNKEFADFDNAPRHRFSHSHKVKMRRLFDGDTAAPTTKPRIKLKYVWIAIILSCVLALAGFTCYYIINGFSFKVYKDHSVVEYLDIESGKTSIEEEFYLPETNEIIVENEYLASTWRIIQYNYNNHNLVFHQNTVDSSLNINTENRIVKLTYVGDCKAFYIEQGEELILCWFQDGYIFTITGSLDKETAIELAKTARIR